MLLEHFDYFPCYGRVVPNGVRIAGEAQVDPFVGDMFTLKLAVGFCHNVFPRCNLCVECVADPVKHVRSETVITTVRTTGIYVQSVVAVFACSSFRLVDRFHLLHILPGAGLLRNSGNNGYEWLSFCRNCSL